MITLLSSFALIALAQGPVDETPSTAALELTGGEYHLGIAGEGFFRVDVGSADFVYTRDGRFRLSETRHLVTESGYPLDPQLRLPESTLSCVVAHDGKVQLLLRGKTSLRVHGQVLLTRFANPGALAPTEYGPGILRATEASGPGVLSIPGVDGTGFLRQGFVVRTKEAAQVRGAVVVTLAMEAHARGTEVELGEIAQVVGPGEKQVNAVRAVELGYAPAPGYSRVFRSDRILDAIRREFPKLDVRINGQPAIRVYPQVVDIAGTEIANAARVQLLSEFATEEIEFEPRKPIEDVSVPAGIEEYEIRVQLTNVPSTSGPLTVPVDILVDGTRYRTIWTSWDVSVWRTRPVLARRVRAGEVLSSDHFVTKKVKLMSANEGVLHEGLLAGSVALHDLLPGETVSKLDVQRPHVLALGDTVFLRVRKGAIEAKVSAVALESGAIGDRVRVRTLDGSQELVAVIESRSTCTIELGTD